MKRRWMILLAVSPLAAGSSAVGTYAYLTDQDKAENELGVTENEIHIEETFDPPDDPKPGTAITKAPAVVNDSQVSVYVRMTARFSNSDAEAFCLPLEINSHWVKQSDGYYYYDKILSAGEKTEPLFEKITIRSDIAAEELIPFDVLVYAESVQSYGLTMEEAWSFFGMGKEVES